MIFSLLHVTYTFLSENIDTSAINWVLEHNYFSFSQTGGHSYGCSLKVNILATCPPVPGIHATEFKSFLFKIVILNYFINTDT